MILGPFADIEGVQQRPFTTYTEHRARTKPQHCLVFQSLNPLMAVHRTASSYIAHGAFKVAQQILRVIVSGPMQMRVASSPSAVNRTGVVTRPLHLPVFQRNQYSPISLQSMPSAIVKTLSRASGGECMHQNHIRVQRSLILRGIWGDAVLDAMVL